MRNSLGTKPVFRLDERLQRDTFPVASLTLCELLLSNNAHYPWLILVPRREGITEIYQLEPADRDQLWRESHQVSVWMANHFQFDKLNIGALGNVVSQLHLHHVGRRQNDPAWPGPVWGHGASIGYGSDQVEKIKRAFPGQLCFSA
ncbi:HIT domain-containing protein [Pelovirga terrestris]|uniref:HIT domain-containing protein n=1 Tax=Pelovirga terrestris TaxID=2771352 RepID=A0A8J6UQ69_9BACT|nr:HIT domain-containing protein [Pelovirga terrestris]MBD1401654.1 HIT domain-containing protein [Pelovirga terrestris]